MSEFHIFLFDGLRELGSRQWALLFVILVFLFGDWPRVYDHRLMPKLLQNLFPTSIVRRVLRRYIVALAKTAHLAPVRIISLSGGEISALEESTVEFRRESTKAEPNENRARKPDRKSSLPEVLLRHLRNVTRREARGKTKVDDGADTAAADLYELPKAVRPIVRAIFDEMVTGGQWEGFVERLLIFVLAAYHEFEAIGFVMAAKMFMAGGHEELPFSKVMEGVEVEAENTPEHHGNQTMIRARLEAETNHSSQNAHMIRRKAFVVGTVLSFTIAIACGLVVGEMLHAAHVDRKPQDMHRDESTTLANEPPHGAVPTEQARRHSNAVQSVNGPGLGPGGTSVPNNEHLVLMNVDTGVDDALAILLALHSQENIRLVGIVTEAGNTSAEQAGLNTRFILERFGLEKQIPVAVGSEKTLSGKTPEFVPHIHGVDGLGGVTVGYWGPRVEAVRAELYKVSAVDFILEKVKEHGSKLTIVSTGPFTNLALAIRKNHEQMQTLGRIEAMGGAFLARAQSNGKIGNITDYSEFNVHADPESAAVVIESGIPLSLFPLDVTEKVRLMRSSLTGDTGISSEKLAFLRGVLSQYMKFHAEHLGFEGSFLHDALPITHLIEPALYSFTAGRVVVDCADGPRFGQTRWAEPDEVGGNIQVATAVSPERVLKLLQQRLRRSSVVYRPTQ